MCFLNSKSEKENIALKKDLLTILNLSRFLADEVERPPKKAALTLSAKDAIENLEWACDHGNYVAPEGMVYRCTGSDISAILKKYGLDDNWTPLDALYRVPRWDYMQLLIQWDWVNRRQYIAEYGDCDDFGIIFKGHMTEFAQLNGIMWVIDWAGGHSYNLLFDIQLKDGSTDALNPVVDVLKSKAIVYEPQSDEWMEAPITPAIQGGVACPADFAPQFPRWAAMQRAKGRFVNPHTGAINSGVNAMNPKMYPLTECNLIM